MPRKNVRKQLKKNPELPKTEEVSAANGTALEDITPSIKKAFTRRDTSSKEVAAPSVKNEASDGSDETCQLESKRGKKANDDKKDDKDVNDTPMEEATPAEESVKGSRKARKRSPPAASKKTTTSAKNTDSSDNDFVDESRQLQVKITRDEGLDKRAVDERDSNSSSQGRGRKRLAATAGKVAAKKSKNDSEKKTAASISVTNLDFMNKSMTPGGNPWNLKIASWNVNGVRAWLEKGGLSYIKQEEPDIFCVQETKCSDDKLPEELRNVDGYECHWLAGDKDGYSGVGLLSKQKPISVKYGIGMQDHDNEGRCITVEYEKFYLVTAYVPNAGRNLVRLQYRMKWDKDFRKYLKQLDAEKPVVLCGDLNVAHEEIDLANPKTNKKNAGFTKEEREGFGTLLDEGFVDTFRHLYPDVKSAYTFWTYMMNARAKNVGWRLDYFVISKRFTDNMCDSVIRKEVIGSDHCPVILFLHV